MYSSSCLQFVTTFATKVYAICNYMMYTTKVIHESKKADNILDIL